MMHGMLSREEIDRYADPEQEQYFLVSQSKLAQLMRAADIRPTDRVVEVGAGVGTVALMVPRCEHLTLVELDERLIQPLQRNAPPEAEVIRGDALELTRSIPFDVLLSNLPTQVTESLLMLLPALTFRTAVLAVGEATDLESLLPPVFVWSEITTITGEDFRPPQPSASRLVKVTWERGGDRSV
jgi:hypothetical protein